ncbi:hypothetical protein BTH160X_60263 [Brochothrix thermosphacta]|nr:hypothetical protein BTH160X_60263 [Brochothrix thermosphacta]
MATVIEITSNALKRKIQLKRLLTPQSVIINSSRLSQVSFLYVRVSSHTAKRNSVAQIERTKINSIAGKPVKREKSPMDPKIAIAIDNCIKAILFIVPPCRLM